MNQYTELMENYAVSIDPMDDDYQERLLEAAGLFRGFNEALTLFLYSKGLSNEADSVDEKVRFMKEKFKSAGISVPRGIESWFTSNKNPDRKNAFKICFALGLNVEETNHFFRTVKFERSFDCHTVSESVYYFCMKNDRNYNDAEWIINQLGSIELKDPVPEKEILFTGSIVNYIESINDENLLIRYITDHAESFCYHNATAVEFVKKFWNEITGVKGSIGLAEKEGVLIDRMLNSFHSNPIQKIDSDSSHSKKLSKGNPLKDDEYVVVSEKDSSVWTIYSQIMGLDHYQEKSFNQNRSLSPAFKNNVLLPLRADDCFPSRQSIEKIINGKTSNKKYEEVRKVIIFLAFYTFWVRKIIEADNVHYKADPVEGADCLDTINKYLLDAGYPELYYGNPYDWIFMWALNNEHPLPAFRSYILEVFDIKNEDVEY